MKTLSIPIMLLALFIFSACSSQNAQSDQYYSLVLAADADHNTESASSTHARLVVGPLLLPSYLDQRGLPIQIGNNTIRNANHHLWAEPLDEAISKVLVADLAASSTLLMVNRNAGRWTEDADCRLRLEFDKFHSTSNSLVVGSGRYWLSSTDIEVKRSFNYEHTLFNDGYASAVEELRVILSELAQDITATVSDENICTKS